jgi:hypothetical protein
MIRRSGYKIYTKVTQYFTDDNSAVGYSHVLTTSTESFCGTNFNYEHIYSSSLANGKWRDCLYGPYTFCSGSTSASACSSGNCGQFYLDTSAITIDTTGNIVDTTSNITLYTGSRLYLSSSLELAPDGYYASGGLWYQIGNGAGYGINAGTFISSGSCPIINPTCLSVTVDIYAPPGGQSGTTNQYGAYASIPYAVGSNITIVGTLRQTGGPGNSTSFSLTITAGQTYAETGMILTTGPADTAEVMDVTFNSCSVNYDGSILNICNCAVTLTSIGTTNKVGSTACDLIGTTPEIFLDSTDYAKYIANGGCLANGSGANQVSTIRDAGGAPLTGTFYFVWYGSSCSKTTFKSTLGNLSLRPTQC